MEEISFITHNFNLPNHHNELSKAEEVIGKLNKKFNLIQEFKKINDKNHDEIYNELIKILDYVGRLSTPAFQIEDELERMYTLHYPKSPKLAKKLFNNHYNEIHKSYNKLKNKCFRMLDEVDDEYINVHKKYPPNWKI